ncbi:MAG: HAD family hydrolase [Turneriella sp.]|nr:HAD family hydrolase [Turneriella sp.]
MRYRWLALDIDGTVFSSEGILYPAYRQAIAEFCQKKNITLNAPDGERILQEIGKPVKQIFANLFPQLTEQDRDFLSDRVLEILCQKIAAGEGYFYPGVSETVADLVANGIQILVASNGRKPYIEAILAAGKIAPLALPLVAIDGATIHNKTEILNCYIAAGVEPKALLMVGDRISDHEAARAVGCDFAWCAYGHAQPGEIPDYELRLENFSALRELLVNA